MKPSNFRLCSMIHFWNNKVKICEPPEEYNSQFWSLVISNSILSNIILNNRNYIWGPPHHAHFRKCTNTNIHDAMASGNADVLRYPLLALKLRMMLMAQSIERICSLLIWLSKSHILFYVCSICRKGLFYVCSICGKGFKRGHHQLDHIKTHTEVRPHQCQHCLKRFTTKSALRRHELTHTKVKRIFVKFVGSPFHMKTDFQPMWKPIEGREVFHVPFVD